MKITSRAQRKTRVERELDQPNTPETLKKMVRRTLFQVHAYTKLEKAFRMVVLTVNVALLGAIAFIALKAVVLWSLTIWVPLLVFTALSIAMGLALDAWRDGLNRSVVALDERVPRIITAHRHFAVHSSEEPVNIVQSPGSARFAPAPT